MKFPGSLTYDGRDKHGNDLWEYRIDLQRDPVTGKRQQKSQRFRGTKKECERQAWKFYSELQDGQHQRITSNISYREYLIDHWLPNTDIRSRVKETYGSIIRTHLVPNLGSILLPEVKTYHIRDYFKEKSQNGRKDGRLGGLSPNTLNNHLIVIKKSLADAVVSGFIEHNPAVLPKGQRFFVKPRRISGHSYTVADSKAFLYEASKEKGCYEALATCYYMGMRRSEVCGLQWGDIDLDQGTIRIARSLHVLKGGQVVTEEPKSKGSKRNLPIPSTTPLMEILKSLKMDHKLVLAAAGRDLFPTDWIFVRDDFSPIRPQQLTKAFKRVTKRINRSDVVLHGLRHNYATNLFKSGADIHTVSRLLGHATPGYTLNAYIDSIPNEQREAVDRLFAKLEARDG
ncbi:MAG: site-specific integrase [Planctomycetes bacterium]|nr:site-specific integrase [Planctomycetota bacterium]